MQDKIIEFVERKLRTDFSGHDLKHSQRVVNNAQKIMKVEGGNEKIILTACYLHDTIDHKLFRDQASNIKEIRELLTDDYTQKEINEIIDIITSISYSNKSSFNLVNLNAQIVCDADRLDAVGAFGIIRAISFGASHKRPFYEDENIKESNNTYTFNKSTNSTLSHFYDKLLKLEDLMYTSYAKELAKERTKVLKTFLNQFYEELK